MTHRLDEVNKKMARLKTFFSSQDLQIRDNDVRTVLKTFLELKRCFKNINNDIHFLAYYLANTFLKNRHSVTIDLTKATGSAGPDIELEEIVAEIKTTIPLLENDFGAKQKEEIRKDLERLENSTEKYKYFFVIDDETERIARQKHGEHYPSVRIVNLLRE